MIRSQQGNDSFRFAKAKIVNLPLLKNQIDHKVLKITMLINNLRDFAQENKKKIAKKSHLSERAVQTNEKQNIADSSQAQFYNLCKDLTTLGEEPRAQETNILIEQKSNVSNNRDRRSFELNYAQQIHKMKKNKEVCHLEAVSQIDLQLSQLQSIEQLSPIKFIKYSKTDRTQRSFAKKTNPVENRICVTNACITKLQDDLNAALSKERRQITDPKVRLNLLIKIEQRFNSNLIKQKSH